MTPIEMQFEKNPPTITDILKMGIDVCKALEICESKNILHRDIKPANIFISATGHYKLGDFGVSRIVESSTSGASTKVGTLGYMAPEVYLGSKYGNTVDLYSLGLVLYRFLNKGRLPFLPEYPAQITPSDRENARIRRIKGDPLPVINGLDGSLMHVILKACDKDPMRRYQKAVDMRKDLENVLSSTNDGHAESVTNASANYGYAGSTSNPSADYGDERTLNIYAPAQESMPVNDNTTIPGYTPIQNNGTQPGPMQTQDYTVMPGYTPMQNNGTQPRPMPTQDQTVMPGYTPMQNNGAQPRPMQTQNSTMNQGVVQNPGNTANINNNFVYNPGENTFQNGKANSPKNIFNANRNNNKPPVKKIIKIIVRIIVGLILLFFIIGILSVV